MNPELEPAGVVTTTAPLFAVVGIVAEIVPAVESWENLVDATPPNVTVETPDKFEPKMVTAVPGAAFAGVIEVMPGVCPKQKAVERRRNSRFRSRFMAVSNGR
jgi:hypothetical protein